MIASKEFVICLVVINFNIIIISSIKFFIYFNLFLVTAFINFIIFKINIEIISFNQII